MDWDDIRYFLALARTGSVRAAGASLTVSHSTVARRVEGLETRLSTRLFDRSRDGYTLTEAGLQMMPGAERVERELATIERGLVGQDERLEGTVSLTCCDDFVSDVLVRGLAPFCAAHPGIELQMTTDSRSFDLSKREADLAVRILGQNAQPPEHLIGRRVAPMVVCSYVARAHEARLDPELEGTEPRWVAFEDRRQVEALISSSSYPTVPPWGAFSSLPLIIQACREGLGISMLPTYVGDQQPDLRRLAKPDLRHLGALWLLCHLDLRDNARIRATRQEVTRILKARLPLFEGSAPQPG